MLTLTNFIRKTILRRPRIMRVYYGRGLHALESFTKVNHLRNSTTRFLFILNSMSSLQRDILKVMDENPQLFDITRKLSVHFLKNTEMSSQDAAWYLLQEPIPKSSIAIVYINTSWTMERSSIQGTRPELDQVKSDG